MLARREHARGELAAKLAAGGFGPEATERVLDALEAEGLLSEERFTEQFVRSRLDRGQGPRLIREALRQRGIAAAAAKEAVERDDAGWAERASQARSGRFGAAAPADYREWARQARFLERRGFTTEHIRLALGPPPQR
ncbi:MAG: regulatory protein RecX [Thiotrichales bacterium]|nr:regulatory protein RecX [Thiotrichales bacterium]MCY4286289.1 regulatory protein RecX [Thiotrichales bacterium]MCY4351423.1 regulatory protein RecX [Thiotrichales bacterium]